MTYSDRIESIYQVLKNDILQEKDSEKQLLKMQDLIHFSWMNAPLRFGDIQLDQVIQDKISAWESFSSVPDEMSFVHVASTLFHVGGHTRCMMNIISHFPEHKHTVVLTRQHKDVPNQIAHFFATNKVSVVRLDTQESLLGKAKSLRNHVLKINPSKVFSFHHPDDLIPVLSITGSNHFQSLLYNHADHVFSLGNCFFDKHMEFRKTGAQISRFGKRVDESKIISLPLPLNAIRENNVNVVPQKGEYDFVLGTLTNKSKVKPYLESKTVVEVMFQMARQYSNALFLIIGLDEEFTERSVNSKLPDNLKCLGIISDPDIHYREMDFFLEPFPVGSGLGIIEACQYGAIPLFGKHPVKLCSTFEVFHDEIQQIFNPLIVGLDQSEQLKYYLAQSDADKILFKEKFKTLIQEQHCGDGWKSALLKGCNNTATDQILKQVDILIKEEAIFFQTYMKKNDKELLSHLLGLKKIIGRRLLLVLLFSPKIKISLFSFLSDNRGRFIHRMIFG